jgi:hypothetical protein
MPEEKEKQDMERLLMINLMKYFEKTDGHSQQDDEAAIRNAVTHYFGGNDDYRK